MVTTAVEITDIKTVGWKYKVIIKETGKTAWFPTRWTEIKPGVVIIPLELRDRILGMPAKGG
jgi:hypothetical protein